MANQIRPLPGSELRRECRPEELGFNSTEELPDLEGVVGQERALRAIGFGIEIKSVGYHMYALGPIGTGKTTTVRKFLEQDAAGKPAPDDWLYVNNFQNPDKPKALRMSQGCGSGFRNDMDQFVEGLKSEVPRSFEEKEYAQEQQQLQQDYQRRAKELFQQLEADVRESGFGLMQTPQGIMLAPLSDDEMMTPDQLAQLPEKRRRQIEARQEELERETRETMRQAEQLQKEGRERSRELDRRVIAMAVDSRLNELKERYRDFPEISGFLGEVRKSLLHNVEAFKHLNQLEQASGQEQMLLAQMQGGQTPSFDEYRVNLVVDNSHAVGAPVVEESHPTVPNLIGRIEHQGQFGTLVTNYRLIKGGALHRANGGYLMLDAVELLTKPAAWQFLKRALKSRKIVIEGINEAMGALTTRTLQPEPIPLETKVIVIGDPMIYSLLYQHDPEFQELFKVKADFETRMDWSPDNMHRYARFVGTVCREEGLRHFDPSGVARVVEFGGRMASHRDKLAIKFGDIVDLLRQSSYWAGVNGNALVLGSDVKQAVDEQIFRGNRVEKRLQEMIEEGAILIDTRGKRAGQINGLAVLSAGDYSFGHPSRITARTYAGSEGVVNIDRESKLGGPLHNKGSMILAGYLGGRYAHDMPLSLSATLTFEQLYSGVEGDSASSAELFALLSALTNLPLRQDLAVTGSVNQHGEIQAIGGVNEKVEGFFSVCRMTGLTGKQGVVIPQSNVRHLMLRDEVVEAVEAGDFHIYPITTVDEGIGLLCERDAGDLQEDGTYPEDTVNSLVKQAVRDMAEIGRKFASS
ncbi:Lon protease family protein [Thiohalomonas denitrificans]|uniref:endopeptidase La n=1 Tax=Thiohalomonas denitrificans TaxID=415747 RepID=A0A1G5PVY4_9GAMM|nr:ATP-binding protein [Thiohalomonas denitrificans]SCZ53420.1 lon-related putative ATP-dependent protease [Thiohalomonas denitrificans]